MKTSWFLAAALIISSLSPRTWGASAPPSPPLEVDRIEGGTLYFKGESPKSITTRLHNLKVLGTLTPQAGGPTSILLTAMPCASCVEERAVYLLRTDGAHPSHFVFPGKILDPKTKEVLLDSKAFYGRCLPEYGDIYLVLQKEKVDRRKGLQSSVFVAEPTPTHLKEKLMEKERRLPKLNSILARVKKKECFEIEGRNRLMLRKPLDLTPRRGGEDDPDGADDDDAIKENETQKDFPPAVDETPDAT